MPTCKQCLHEELCNIQGYADADDCCCYKDKADFVEVVRCKDCPHQEQCCEFIMISGKDKTIDFCSEGIRK